MPCVKKPLLFLLLTLSVFIVCLARVDRIVLKKNNGFNISRLLVPLTKGPATSFDKAIFDQEFHYLDRGHQSFVFLSEDGNYILKLYRFGKDQEKEKVSFQSYQLAIDELKEESGLIGIHLCQTDNLQKNVTLVDRLQIGYSVPLDKLAFIVQKKANPFFPYLEKVIQTKSPAAIQRAMDQVVGLIVSRCEKGIEDQDAILEKNYGWLDGRTIHIDIGRFVKNSHLNAQAEVTKITHSLKTWLHNEHPDAEAHFDQALKLIPSGEEE